MSRKYDWSKFPFIVDYGTTYAVPVWLVVSMVGVPALAIVIVENWK